MTLPEVKTLIEKIARHKKTVKLRIDYDGGRNFECTFESLKLTPPEYEFPGERHDANDSQGVAHVKKD